MHKIDIEINIPNEPTQVKSLQLVSKNVESNENVVIKVASGFRDVIHSKNSNPYTTASTRGTNGTSPKIKTEIVLLQKDKMLNSGTDILAEANYAQHSGDKTAYRTSTVQNGKNENNTEILDFEYIFPIDKSSGDDTFRQYAPISAPDGQWDQERASTNEIAKYRCLDSGQGCGAGKVEVSLNGNLKQSTVEGFNGYTVTHFDHTLNNNYLLNMNGTIKELMF